MLKKFENWVFYFFLFAIPISVRHIFGYQAFNFVEWTSVYIYGTDILFFILIAFWVGSRIPQRGVSETPRLGAGRGVESRDADESLERVGHRPSRGIRLKTAGWFLVAFVVVAGVSIIHALDVHTAIFQWVKLLEGVALYFYIKDYALGRFKLSHGFEALVAGGAFQAVIAIAQFMTQGSLGLKYLGESPLAPAFAGIAAFYVNGIKIMRAYGTTPHSNVLALYLFIALGAFYSIAIYQKRAWFWHVLHAVILWAFLLTFSRVIIGLWLLTFITRSFLIRFYKPFHKEFWEDSVMRRRSLKIFGTTVVVCVLFVAVYWPYVVNRAEISATDEAIQLRVLYNHESLASGHNLFGLGMGNFVPWLMTQALHLNREVYQPVHNIYLLIYAETGPFAVALFILFLAFLLYDFYRRPGFKKLYHFSFGLIIIAVLVAGLFDHFLWTIQAGRLMFWLALGLLAGAE
jgi:hypothetical protein